MTPAGRPTRSTSSSKKAVSIRLTVEEHDAISKAAHPMYISDWLRRLALEKVSEPVPPPPPSGAMLDAMTAAFAPLLATLDDTKRTAIMDPIADLARQFDRLVQNAVAAEKFAASVEESENDLWNLVYKFAKYVKHDTGCSGRPCECTIKPIAVELGTALGMAADIEKRAGR